MGGRRKEGSGRRIATGLGFLEIEQPTSDEVGNNNLLAIETTQPQKQEQVTNEGRLIK